MICHWTNNRSLYHQNYHSIGKYVITFKNTDVYQNYLENFLKNTTVQVFFFSKAPHVSNEQPYLKTTRLCDDLLSSLFRFFYFIFSALISFSLCFPISPSLFFFLKPLSSKVFAYLYVVYIIYIRKLTNFSLTKKFITF